MGWEDRIESGYYACACLSLLSMGECPASRRPVASIRAWDRRRGATRANARVTRPAAPRGHAQAHQAAALGDDAAKSAGAEAEASNLPVRRIYGHRSKNKLCVEGLQAQRASAGHGSANIRRRCPRGWLPRRGWLARVAAASSSLPCGQPALPRHQQGLARARSRKKRIETSRVLPTLARFLHALNHARTSSSQEETISWFCNLSPY